LKGTNVQKVSTDYPARVGSILSHRGSKSSSIWSTGRSNSLPSGPDLLTLPGL